MKTFVFGASNIDIITKANQELILKDSNIVSSKLYFGGVGRNICENLSNLELKFKFITLFGDDEFAQLIKDDCHSKDIDISDSILINGNQSKYIGILEQDQELFLGLNDMDILNKVSFQDFEHILSEINDQDLLVFDLNFKQDLLLAIFQATKALKFVDATSSVKVKKIANYLADIDLLKLNTLEASQLVGFKIETKNDYIKALKFLHTRGLKKCIISYPQGLYYSDQKQIYHYLHNMNLTILNVTGAGDALMAGFVYSFSQNQELDYSLKFALACACFNVINESVVASYSQDVIKDIILNSNIKGEKIYEH